MSRSRGTAIRCRSKLTEVANVTTRDLVSLFDWVDVEGLGGGGGGALGGTGIGIGYAQQLTGNGNFPSIGSWYGGNGNGPFGDTYIGTVIDNGTGYTKMGFAGNVEPQYIIPTVTASKTEVDSMKGKRDGIEDLDFFIGDKALNNHNTHQIN